MWGRRGTPRLYAMTLPLSTYNMLDFNNTEIAFSSKSRGELQNAYWLFNTIKYPWLVKCAKVATSIALKIHFPLAWAVKPTLYKQFVGGETLQDCSAAINHLMKYNVKSTLDYSAESEQIPEGIQATFEETLRSIDFAKGNTNLAYAVFKPSTITTDELLAKASEKLPAGNVWWIRPVSAEKRLVKNRAASPNGCSPVFQSMDSLSLFFILCRTTSRQARCTAAVSTQLMG